MEKLKPFKRGDDSLLHADVANKYVVETLNSILSLEITPAGYGRFLFEKGKSLLDLTGLKNLLGSADLSPGPFELIDESDDGGPKLMVNPSSYLSLSPDPDDGQDIAGLGNVFTVAAGKWIYVEGTWNGDDGSFTAAIVVSSASDFSSTPFPVAFDSGDENKKQLKVRRLIGFILPFDAGGYPDAMVISGGSGESLIKLQVVQCLRTNLILAEDCYRQDTVQLLGDFSHVPYQS